MCSLLVDQHEAGFDLRNDKAVVQLKDLLLSCLHNLLLIDLHCTSGRQVNAFLSYVSLRNFIQGSPVLAGVFSFFIPASKRGNSFFFILQAERVKVWVKGYLRRNDIFLGFGAYHLAEAGFLIEIK